MAFWALVQDDVMVNVVIMPDGETGPDGYTFINGFHASPGWGYVDGVVVAPPPPEPDNTPIDLEARVAQLEAIIASLTG